MSNLLPFRTPLTLREILVYVSGENERDEPYALYGNDDETDELLLEATYVIDAPPEVADDDEEIYPAYVDAANLSLLYYDEDLQDVVDLAMDQSDGKVTAAFLVRALNYYDETDEFLDFPKSNA